MRLPMLVLSVVVASGAVLAQSAKLAKVAEIDLVKAIHASESALRAEQHPVGAISVSPDGGRIAVLLGIHPKREFFSSDLVILDAKDIRKVVGRFEVETALFGGVFGTPEIRWSPNGRQVEFGGKVFTLAGAPYCGRGDVQAFLGQDRYIALIDSEMVRDERLSQDIRARRLNVVGPGCTDEVRVPTHELRWEFQDFSSQENLGLYKINDARLSAPAKYRFLVVHFPEGKIVRSWEPDRESGPHGHFIKGGKAVCFGFSGVSDSGRTTSSCWDIENGNKVAEIPANGGFPIMAAANSSRVIVSDSEWQKKWNVTFQEDDGHSVVRRRIVWDSSSNRQIAAWNPGKQKYLDGFVRRPVEDVFPFAISPDGTFVVEGGNGVLRLLTVPR